MITSPAPQILLQTVLQNQFQTQQYGNTRVTKPHEYNEEVPTNYMKTTCCEVASSQDAIYCNIRLPQEVMYCYATPITTTYKLSKEIL